MEHQFLNHQALNDYGKHNNVERYRNWNDPVAMFDNSAHITSQGANDNKGASGFLHHHYDSIASTLKSGNPEMTINPDGSYSLTQ